MYWYKHVLKNYAVFSGRARRTEYWGFQAVNIALIASFVILSKFIGAFDTIGMIYNLLILVPSVAVTMRRLHDTDRSGWWWLVSFIPIIGPIVLLVFMLFDSTPDDNQYGPYPK
ncbi:DUF805 domain-containing protein [Alteromonas lipotrueiana]|uniref:DUF805 domain-containing protein n=1 Tax=Alteromonas lipotrueiana TaxID=2803815 RepID=UPI001C4944D6|nr:DUF805 domain-containing protein [Alteromonas lipotrueiana]|tara:strand:- start:446 stop:787 length:342 start_codon:yes stop_codon:yes gene_type:complete